MYDDPLDAVIDRIYDAAFAPGEWTSVLSDIAALADAEGALLFRSSEVGSDWAASHKIEELVRRFFAGQWHLANERTSAALQVGRKSFAVDFDIFTPEQLRKIPIYQDLLYPLGFGWGAATTFSLTNGSQFVLSIEKAHAKGPIPKEVQKRLDLLRPHLIRSALVAERFSLTQAETVVDLVSKMGLACAALDSVGRVVSHNALWDDVSDHATINARDRITFSAPVAMKRYGRFIAESVLNARSEGLTLTLTLPRSADAQPAVAYLVPVGRKCSTVFHSLRHLLIVTRPSATREIPPSFLAELYGLTMSESRVASLIARGLDVAEVARGLGVGRETVRSHLKSVFVKTDLRSQSELRVGLASLLGWSPAN